MTYFSDLSPYTYFADFADKYTVNIGWLNIAHPYSKGTTANDFLKKLRRFCYLPVMITRGFHTCQFCNGSLYNDREIQRGNEICKVGGAEIRVFSSTGIIYAAPTLIYHYVVDHHYCPPSEFIEAVLTCPLPDSPEYDAKASKFRWWHEAKIDAMWARTLFRQKGQGRK